MTVQDFDSICTARFNFSLVGFSSEKTIESYSEPDNFPKILPKKIPNLIEKSATGWRATDDGYSYIFGQSAQSDIQLENDGKLNVTECLFKLIPDLQGLTRKRNFSDLQQVLLQRSNFNVPVSETVSIFKDFISQNYTF